MTASDTRNIHYAVQINNNKFSWHFLRPATSFKKDVTGRANLLIDPLCFGVSARNMV
eukprot:SAG25_NODE_905_length_4824_cov_5.405920_1_plen_57_part_00